MRNRDSTYSRQLVFALAFWGVSGLSFSAHAEGDSPSPSPESDCIASPAEYQEAWENFQVGCVSPTLYATVHERSLDSLYPLGQPGGGVFWYAFAAAHNNLEMFLLLNRDYGDPSKPTFNPNKVTAGILTIMGFATIRSAEDLAGYNLAVYTVPEDDGLVVPTLEAWFLIFERELGQTYPLPAQKDLVLNYSRLSLDQNVVQVYADISGCSYLDLLEAKNGPGPYESCDPDYNAALEAAVCNPYDEGCTSLGCFESFFADYQGPRNAAAIRAALAQCQDVSQWNTGVGLGFSTLPNPLVCKPAWGQTVTDRYMGREFILKNRPLSALPELVDLPLANDPDKGVAFLITGYCS